MYLNISKLKNLSIIFLLLYLSCNQNSGLKNKGNRFYADNSFLQYKWSICSIQYTGKNGSTSELSLNVCSEMMFGGDANGYFKMANGEILPFTWQIIGNKLFLRHSGKYEKDALLNTDGTFTILRLKNKEFTEIDLADSVENSKYILRR